MILERRWAFVLGAILSVNAVFFLLHSDGRIEGYVGAAICGLCGILIIVLALRRPARDAQSGTDTARRERSGE